MNIRVLLIALVLIAAGGAAFFLMRPRASVEGPSRVPGFMKPSQPGLSELAARVPKNAGSFLALDGRGLVDPKTDLTRLRDQLKDYPDALKAWDEAERSAGIKADEVVKWVQPAAFMAVLPAPGEPTLWGHPGEAPKAGSAELTSCKSNLKNMATAMEMWSTDNQGRYPKSTALLTPSYLKTIPSCPAAQKDTYSQSLVVAASPDAFTLVCQGHHHPQEKENFPQYSSYTGLITGVEGSPARPPSPEPELVFGAPVADEKLASEQLVKLISPNGPPKEETVGNVKFWVVERTYVAVHQGYILGGSSSKAVEALVATTKADSLASQPQFVEMRKKFPAERGGVAYVPLQGLAEMLPTWEPRDTDARTQEAVRGLQYLALSLAVEQGQFTASGFLSLDEKSQSAFVKTLLTAPGSAMQSADVYPAEWGNYSAVNLRYLVNVVLEGMRLVPSLRGQVDQGLAAMEKEVGVSPDGIWAAYSGEVAWSSNVFKKLPAMMQGNFQRARRQGQGTACKSNLKNIATALEMYSTDNAGRYPASLKPLVPNYLRTIPTCPKAQMDTYSQTYAMAVTPDAYTFACGGQHHGQANYPQYNSYNGLIAGDTREEPERPVQDDTPTYLVALGVKDAAKAEELLGKIPLPPPTNGPKVGEVQLLQYSAPLPVLRCTIAKPPMILIAVGPEAQEMLSQALDVRSPVSKTAAFQAAWKDQPERWIHAGYLDLTPTLQSLRPFLDSIPDANQAKLARAVLDGVKDATSASYAIIDKDGIRACSNGGATIAAGGVATVAAVLVPNFIRARSSGQLTACKSNLKNEATALEMYATDNGGRYPPSLKLLTPNYLKTIPQCPTAGRDTYMDSYRCAAAPDNFTLMCQGNYHTASGVSQPNYPQYSSTQGLILP